MKKRVQKPRQSGPHPGRREPRISTIIVIMTAALALLLMYQAVTDIVEGNYTMGLNYLGQPVGAGAQLIAGVVALVVGSLLVWEHFHPKPRSTKEKKGKSDAFHFRWPHDIP